MVVKSVITQNSKISNLYSEIKCIPVLFDAGHDTFSSVWGYRPIYINCSNRQGFFCDIRFYLAAAQQLALPILSTFLFPSAFGVYLWPFISTCAFQCPPWLHRPVVSLIQAASLLTRPIDAIYFDVMSPAANLRMASLFSPLPNISSQAVMFLPLICIALYMVQLLRVSEVHGPHA